jgi:lipopolysaccharide/colanic/teichoic acid biosynthesis glycosyltransferase
MIEKWYQNIGKRLLDVILSLAALTLLSPIFALLGVLIYLRLGSPIIFKQERPGLSGNPFTIYKFRTMREDHDAQGNLLPDSARLTPLGKLMRQTSLDELPELFNVLSGDMSLIGPRPLLMDYLDRYTSQQKHRHDVRPGITGWAQINGRQEIRFSERIEFDLWYIDHLSLWLDIRIIIRTVKKVISGTGVKHGQDVHEVDDLEINI